MILDRNTGCWQQSTEPAVPLGEYIKWTVFVNVTTKSTQHAHARMIWLEFGLFSTTIAIIRACACWALFVVTLTNTVHLIYIYILYIYDNIVLVCISQWQHQLIVDKFIVCIFAAILSCHQCGDNASNISQNSIHHLVYCLLNTVFLQYHCVICSNVKRKGKFIIQTTLVLPLSNHNGCILALHNENNYI